MNEAVKIEIEKLKEQKVNVLRERYRELFGEDTESTSHPHLLRRIAWRLQAAGEGDLTERARQRAAELIADVDLRLNSRRKLWRQAEAPTSATQRDSRLPKPGTIIKREYQGRAICAKVLESGFEYDGRRFDSLSAIACEVSGTRWNGFEFFRLKETKNA